MKRIGYEATRTRFLLALAFALVLGPAFLVIGFGVVLPVGDYKNLIHSFERGTWDWHGLAFGLFPILAVFYGFGLAFLALPGWIVLHVFGCNGRVSAFVWGALSWFIGVCVLFGGSGRMRTPDDLLVAAILAVFGGGLTGLAIWRIAYRKAEHPNLDKLFG